MGSTFRNVLSKSTQSILGFALFAIQSRYLTKEDLAIFAVAQSLIVIVSLFDFGVGVRLTTWIIETFKDQSVPTEYRRVTSSTLILSKRNQIFFVALLQSVIFGLIFLLLVRGITNEIELSISLLFALTILLHSFGLNLGRLFLTTGEISILVKLQLIGAIIAFLFSVLALKSSFNLKISLLALCFSSIFLGLCTVVFFKKKQNELTNFNLQTNTWKSGKSELKKMMLIQTGQIFQVALPVLVQFILVSNFNPSFVIVYSVCQRFVSSIGNIFGAEIQLNYTTSSVNENVAWGDVARFSRNFLGFILSNLIVTTIIWLNWELLFKSIGQPSFATILSFVPLGFLVLVDQAIRYRLYALAQFMCEMRSNMAYFFILIIMLYSTSIDSIMVLNLFLILSYIPKFLFSINFRLITFAKMIK